MWDSSLIARLWTKVYEGERAIARTASRRPPVGVTSAESPQNYCVGRAIKRESEEEGRGTRAGKWYKGTSNVAASKGFVSVERAGSAE